MKYQYNQATLDLGGPYYDRCPYEKTCGYTEKTEMEAECSEAAIHQGKLGAPRS